MFDYSWKNQAQRYFIAIQRKVHDPKNVPFIFKAKMEFPRSQNMQPSPHPAWQGNIENVELYRVESSVNTQTTLAAPLLPLCGFLFWHNGQNTMFSLLPPPGGNTSKNKGCVYPCLLSHRLPQDENSDGRGRRTISTSAQSGEKN